MKKVKVTIYALAILVLIGLMGYVFSMDTTVFENSIHGEVNVIDGVAQIEGFEREVLIEKDGKYELSAAWHTQPEGMITGVELINEAGVNINTFSAAWLTMQTGPMELEKGKYTLKATYITSAEALDEFYYSNEYLYPMEEWDVPYTSTTYEFKANEYFKTDYDFEIRKSVPVLGIAVVFGILLGFCFVAIILTLAVKGDEKVRYDERQELVRGRGFKYAFVGFVTYNIIVYVLDLMQIDLYMSIGVSALASTLVGITIYAVYCIWNEGYFALNHRRGVVLATIGIGGWINIVIGAEGIISGTIWANGQFSIRVANVFCGIMCIIVWVVLLLKCIKDRKEA
ncbi:MAG: hypothetical protein IJW63_08580 [Lachnospiraceae bacterium]|nr:hypothetical protein [Lachnospiraceae bacterium]